MKSLADVLGVTNPDEPSRDVTPVEFSTGEALARAVLNSGEYRASLFRRIKNDELSPQVEKHLYELAFGKPVSRIEVKDVSELTSYTNAQLAERAAELARIARELDDEEQRSKTVH